MTSFLISGHSFHQKCGFSVTFLFLNQLSSNVAQEFKINSVLILIFGSKSGLGDDFGQYDTKTIILRRFWPNPSWK